jgi:hypothetical protein
MTFVDLAWVVEDSKLTYYLAESLRVLVFTRVVEFFFTKKIALNFRKKVLYRAYFKHSLRFY